MTHPDYPPINLLRRVSSAYPGCWERLAEFHADNGKNGLPAWDRACYAPIAAALAVVSNAKSSTMTMQERMSCIHDANTLAALAPWRLSKEVFLMDPELEQLLISQDGDDLNIPSEILLRLPYQAFYVELNHLRLYDEQPHGMFVHIEHDVTSGARELRFLFLCNTGSVLGLPLHLDCSTIAEAVAKISAIASRNARSQIPVHHETVSLLRKALQIVLYLCARNADVTPSDEQRTVTRRTPTVRDRYQEIRRWDVGIRIGSAIRRSADRSGAASLGGSHASPRPHMRRGHWHHFWTGKRSDPDSRSLVLQWVDPTLINATTNEELPVTLHSVQD